MIKETKGLFDMIYSVYHLIDTNNDGLTLCTFCFSSEREV